MGERESDAIELIYDEHVAEEKRKHGTKYEILAAIVFKALAGDERVVHDLRLRGSGKRTKHQIDVTVEHRDGRRLRSTSTAPMRNDAVRSQRHRQGLERRSHDRPQLDFGGTRP